MIRSAIPEIWATTEKSGSGYRSRTGLKINNSERYAQFHHVVYHYSKSQRNRRINLGAFEDTKSERNNAESTIIIRIATKYKNNKDSDVIGIFNQSEP